MAFWLFKEEPSHYSYDDLIRDKRTVWDGVENNLALIHLRAVKKGDLVFFYHTGDEKAVIGIAAITKGPYPDPNRNDPKLVVVDVRAVRRLPRPVTLKEIKANRHFADIALLKNSRLSVMPVTTEQWGEMIRIAAELGACG